MTTLAPEATSATTTPSTDRRVQAALDRIHEVIAGLENLADLVADRPEIADAVCSDLARHRSPRVLIYVSDRRAGESSIPEYIATLAAAAAGHGAEISQSHDANYGGIDARFGFLTLHVYADLAAVGSVATRTRRVEVTDWQPDPLLAVFGADTAAAGAGR